MFQNADRSRSRSQSRSQSRSRGTSDGREGHLLEDVGRSHEAETDGLHDGVGVPPAPPVVP